jgi:uncharacterized phage protein (TIGR01671 family)
MREIKFRAWHIPTKKMFDVFSWCKDCVFEDSMDGVGTSPTLPAEAKDCVLMQFTGIKDCNGKEIYEGDILKSRYFNGSEYDCLQEVVFNETCFCLKMIKGNEKSEIGVLSFFGRTKSSQLLKGIVIGNIYQNTEM